MQYIGKRLDYLFRSTRGLALTAIAVVSIITAIWGTLSGPMVEWGVRDITVNTLNMDLVEAEREGRIILLYHTIAMTIIAIEVYFMTEILPMRKHEQTIINGTITVGYLTADIFGLLFAYWGHNFTFHGLFILGQSLVFFAGILLCAALWPWKKEYLLPADSPFAHTKGGVDLERAAFFIMAVSTLISATWGAVTGSFWANGHETFLGEDLIRNPHKTYLQKAIIGHLHIMLTLVAVGITLIVGRWIKFQGILHRWAMPIMIAGTITITFGALSVVWLEWAHNTIYVGSTMVMFSALLYVIYAWDKQIKDGTAHLKKPNFFQKLGALFSDPLKFGPGWQMVFMNFTVSGVGIFLAIKLDEIFRVWPHREERITLTGHWHILAALIATIILMYFADLSGMKGKVRKWFGWSLIILSDIAFGSATIFSMKRLFVDDLNQQGLVNTTMLLMDLGLGIVLIMLALFMIWRLYDLVQEKGHWSMEFSQERKLSAQSELEEQKRKLEELNKIIKEESE